MATQSPAREIRVSVSDTLESLDLRISCLKELGALFRAINQSSDQDEVVEGLANVGFYLCEDWANITDQALEQLSSLQEKFR